MSPFPQCYLLNQSTFHDDTRWQISNVKFAGCQKFLGAWPNIVIIFLPPSPVAPHPAAKLLKVWFGLFCHLPHVCIPVYLSGNEVRRTRARTNVQDQWVECLAQPDIRMRVSMELVRGQKREKATLDRVIKRPLVLFYGHPVCMGMEERQADGFRISTKSRVILDTGEDQYLSDRHSATSGFILTLL